MQGATTSDARESRKSDGLGGNLDGQICGLGDVFHRRRSAADRARRGGGESGRLREYTSGSCPLHLSLEREGGVLARTSAADQDIGQATAEAGGSRGTYALLRHP